MEQDFPIIVHAFMRQKISSPRSAACRRCARSMERSPFRPPVC